MLRAPVSGSAKRAPHADGFARGRKIKIWSSRIDDVTPLKMLFGKICDTLVKVVEDPSLNSEARHKANSLLMSVQNFKFISSIIRDGTLEGNNIGEEQCNIAKDRSMSKEGIIIIVGVKGQKEETEDKSENSKEETRSYKNYTDENLEEALRVVAEGETSMKAASQHYKIPFGKLNNKFHGKGAKKPGGQCVFTEEEETSFIHAAAKCAD
ncbi:hypothetical protein ILUMI_26554 [Ignelater luminosus]|uniref:HTH psq-type domain-containing protein n=1 Tax=Ignelater luminosus TaxID=2038154 RepID=A0A8K0FVW7_IGNLU|nr:hypothetical protein ILUMI_26554 [Ignelater luminosus]